MQVALKQAQMAFEADEVPVGAVIVHKGRIIAKAHNQIEMLRDPTAHAEMIAVTQATSTLGVKWLNDCILYATIEPCSMCAGALVLSRLKTICYGAKDPKTGACGSVLNIVTHPNLNHRIEVIDGICQEECSAIMTRFFKQKRFSASISFGNN